MNLVKTWHIEFLDVRKYRQNYADHQFIIHFIYELYCTSAVKMSPKRMSDVCLYFSTNT